MKKLYPNDLFTSVTKISATILTLEASKCQSFLISTSVLDAVFLWAKFYGLLPFYPVEIIECQN